MRMEPASPTRELSMETHDWATKIAAIAACCLLPGCDAGLAETGNQSTPMSLMAAGPEDNGQSCFSACANYSGSPYCLPTGYDAKNSAQLERLASRLADESAPITSSWLRSNFEVTEDPCERSDTIFSDGSWINEGYACVLSSKISLPSSNPVSLKIDVPARLRVERSSRDGYKVYTSRDNAILLSFMDPTWHNDWGGEIRYVAVNSNQAMFQVNRGCISVDLAP